MTNEKHLQNGERMEKFDLEAEAIKQADNVDCCRECSRWEVACDFYKQGFNKACDLMMQEATENAWRGVGCCSDKGLYVPLDILGQIIDKLKGIKPVNKFSPEYLEQFKQAQADNQNLHKYLGGEE